MKQSQVTRERAFRIHLIDEKATRALQDQRKAGGPHGQVYAFADKRDGYAVLGEMLLNCDDLSSAKMERSYNGMDFIALNFNVAGAKKLEAITSKNIHRRLAFLVADRIVVAAYIQERIPGGRAVLAGALSQTELQEALHTVQVCWD